MVTIKGVEEKRHMASSLNLCSFATAKRQIMLKFL